MGVAVSTTDLDLSAISPTSVPRATAALIGFLRAQEARGRRTVYVTDDAKKQLGHWARSTLSRGGAAADPPRAAPATPLPVVPPATTSAPPTPSAPPASKDERLAEIRKRAAGCDRCRSLGTLRDQFVFATGNPAARLMLVGEAPGREEELRGEPFVGPAGELLTKILKAMGFERSDVYISNIVKWRPATAPGDRKENRKPTKDEMEASKCYVLEEIAVVQPEVIVALGATAAQGLLDIDIPVGRARGTFRSVGTIPALVTYHPSYLLRNAGVSEKRKVWEDMLLIMERLGMPISEKQRGFFSRPPR